MNPLERLAIVAEKYLEKCDENKPLHKHVLMAQLNHLDGLHDPKPLAAVLQERWDRAYLAALTGASHHIGETEKAIVTSARDVANETIRRHAELMASRDAAIAEVVG